MNITDLPFAILRLQYRIARTPLQLLEDRVMARMDDEAPGRLMYERALGALDAAAGSALRDTDLEESGIGRIQRAAALGEAMRLDEVAEQKKQRADDQLAQKREKAAAAPQEARKESQEKISEARREAEERKQQAARSAAQRTASVKKEVAEAADEKVEAAEKAKRSVENASKAKEKAVTSAAEAELDDAASKRRAATSVRAHADRLEDLSDAEKAMRQADGT
jgi:outer membrane biosynthesis protein TonB